MQHSLPTLGFSYSDLEPHIDAKTMEIHYSKHHQAYVNNLNSALAQYPLLTDVQLDDIIKNLASIPEGIRTAVRNNGGGHLNHTLFWTLLGPNQGGEPVGNLAKAIDKTFGSFEAFKSTFSAAAMARFGSGWVWLSSNRFNQLQVHSTANQDSPLMDGLTPIVGLDLWEHAYYLNYQNKRGDYVEAFWKLLNWNRANELYLAK